jgi:hypothetical protein
MLSIVDCHDKVCQITEIEQNRPRVGNLHVLVEHCQLIAWLPYLTNLANDIHCPCSEGGDTTLAALNIYMGLIVAIISILGISGGPLRSN